MKKITLSFLYLIFMPSIFAFSIKPEQQIIQSDINYAAERGGERDELN
ncbi:MAG: hypothetical protein PUK78_03580 [Spirochaetales bacterium]|nr:hypothetical protein [Spirochaetales bacterium]